MADVQITVSLAGLSQVRAAFASIGAGLRGIATQAQKTIIVSPSGVAQAVQGASKISMGLVQIGTGFAQVGRLAAQGARSMVASMSAMGRALSTVASSVSSFGSILAVAVASAGITKLLSLADTYTMLNAKIGIVTSSSASQAAAMQTIFEIAQRTRSPLESVALTYQRLAIAGKTMGLTSAQTARITETLAKALQISGSTATEATAGMIQLTQAMSKGRLDGDELRSVFENMPSVVNALEVSLHKTRGELWLMGQAGKINGGVLATAILSASATIDAQFAKIPRTIGGALTQVHNQFLAVVGGATLTTGATQKIVLAFDDLRKAIGSPQFASGMASILTGLANVATATAGLIPNIDILSIRFQAFADKARVVAFNPFFTTWPAEFAKIDLAAAVAEAAIRKMGSPFADNAALIKKLTDGITAFRTVTVSLGKGVTQVKFLSDEELAKLSDGQVRLAEIARLKAAIASITPPTLLGASAVDDIAKVGLTLGDVEDAAKKFSDKAQSDIGIVETEFGLLADKSKQTAASINSDFSRMSIADDFLHNIEAISDGLTHLGDGAVTAIAGLKAILERGDTDLDTFAEGVKTLNEGLKDTAPTEYAKALFALRDAAGLVGPLEKYRFSVADLAASQRDGTITGAEYALKMRDLNAAFFEATTPSEVYRKAVEELNTKLAEGRITAEGYALALRDIAAAAGQHAAIVAQAGATTVQAWQNQVAPLEGYQAQLAEINKGVAAGTITTTQAIDLQGKAVAGLAAPWLDVADTAGQALETLFGKSKAATIANIVIHTAEAIMQAATLPPPLDFAKIAAVTALGAAQIAVASGAKFQEGGLVPGRQRGGILPVAPILQDNGGLVPALVPALQQGGLVPRPLAVGLQDGGFAARGLGRVLGSGSGDKIPALLKAGEFVVNRLAVQKHGSLIESLNTATPRFKGGGFVGPLVHSDALAKKLPAAVGHTPPAKFQVGALVALGDKLQAGGPVGLVHGALVGMARSAVGHIGGSGTGDKVRALLEPGEFVVNRKAANENRMMLEAINQGTPRFATGGSVGGNDARLSSSVEAINKSDAEFGGNAGVVARGRGDITVINQAPFFSSDISVQGWASDIVKKIKREQERQSKRRYG